MVKGIKNFFNSMDEELTTSRRLLFYEILKLILGFAVIFSLIIIISNIVTKSAVQRLVRPTERLLDGMKKFGEGNLSARVEVSGNDEITELTEAYKSMADQVQKLMEKVYELENADQPAFPLQYIGYYELDGVFVRKRRNNGYGSISCRNPAGKYKAGYHN